MAKNQKNKIIIIFAAFTLLIAASAPFVSAFARETGVKNDQNVPASKETKEEMPNQPVIGPGKAIKPAKNPYADAKITVEIIPAANKTFCYDILIDGKRFIHQPSIPGLPGNKGFATKQKAKKVADYVVKKIRNNEVPPTVTKDELRKLGVLK